jgi:hypothetical protein
MERHVPIVTLKVPMARHVLASMLLLQIKSAWSGGDVMNQKVLGTPCYTGATFRDMLGLEPARWWPLKAGNVCLPLASPPVGPKAMVGSVHSFLTLWTLDDT